MVRNIPSIDSSSDEEDEELDAQAIYLKMKNDLATKSTRVEPNTAIAGPSTIRAGSTVSSRATTPVRPICTRKSASPSIRSPSRSDTSVTSSPIKSRRPDPTRLSTVDDDQAQSDNDALPEDLCNNNRIKELIAARRAERLAKEQSEAEIEAARLAARVDISGDEAADDVDDEERDAEAVMTQRSKPVRKATKKAMEAMNRETQRISRNMQLAHQVKVKQKHSMHDFLQKFQQKRASLTGEVTVTASSSAPASRPNSSASEPLTVDTPPSSPPSASDSQLAKVAALEADQSDDDLLDPDLMLTQAMARRSSPVDKGKDSASLGSSILNKRATASSPIRKSAVKLDLSDDDDDLEIVTDKWAVFDRVKPLTNNQSRGLLIVRHLANLGHDSRDKSSITPEQLNAQLLRRARLQAKQERDEKIAALKAKGLVVLSAEEREKDQEAIETMLDRARQDAEDVRKRERRAAKAEGREVDMDASGDESEDGDYADEEADEPRDEEEDEEDSEVELSGSEDGDAESEHAVDDLTKEDTALADDEQEPSMPLRDRTKRRVILDEDDEDSVPMNSGMASARDQDDAIETIPDSTTIVSGDNDDDDLGAAFGFAAPAVPANAAAMFASTMEPSQTQVDSQMYNGFNNHTQTEDSMDVFRELVPPPSALPSAVPITDSTESFDEPRTVQTPISHRTMSFSQIPTPSQDMGFAVNSPILVLTQDTVDTVLRPVADSPVVPRRRLLRKIQDEDEVVPSSMPEPNAFEVLKQRKPAGATFDRNKSKAKNMIEEQAEESEDEYAGLGGVSDDESAADVDEVDKQLIDDESNEKIDERQIAAYHAEKARKDHEAQTTKLYKDIMSGALRKQRGDGAFDLDSDDEDQEVERQRRRRREEARKRRLLLGDETLSKFDGDAKKEAFLKTMEDREDSDDDVNFLDGRDVDQEDQDSQSQSQPLDIVSGNTQKRKANDSESLRPAKRVLTAKRAHQDALRKPTSLTEVRESVSFLIEEPHAHEAHGARSDDEEDAGAAATYERAPYSERRTAAPAVIDRLTLKRTASKDVSTSTGVEAGTLAFTSLNRSFSNAVPALLRRATTNNSSAAMPPPPVPGLRRDTSSTTSSKLGADDGFVRRGGSKKSSINYAAREAERRAVVDLAEKARVDQVRKLAGSLRKGAGAGIRRSHLSALGVSKGGFE